MAENNFRRLVFVLMALKPSITNISLKQHVHLSNGPNVLANQSALLLQFFNSFQMHKKANAYSNLHFYDGLMCKLFMEEEYIIQCKKIFGLLSDNLNCRSSLMLILSFISPL